MSSLRMVIQATAELAETAEQVVSARSAFSAVASSEIERHERVVAAGVAVARVQESVGDRGITAKRRRKNLGPGERTKCLRRRLGQHQLAALTQDDELVDGQRHRSRAELVFAPTHSARVQIDGAKAGIEFLTAVKS